MREWVVSKMEKIDNRWEITERHQYSTNDYRSRMSHHAFGDVCFGIGYNLEPKMLWEHKNEKCNIDEDGVVMQKHDSIWDFYKAIGWNHKKKRLTNAAA